MRIFSIITAFIVVLVLFFAILQRETLVRFANGSTAEATAAENTLEQNDRPDRLDTSLVHVLVGRSQAQEVSNGILIRGETEANRQVDVRAETQAVVVSTPLRKGATVSTGDLLCELDPGARAATLLEAQARLIEARARMPEARARVPEAVARVAEAEARLEEALINETAARRLSEDGFASATRLANTEASLSSARAAVVSAQTGLESVQAGLESAQAAIESARAEVEQAEEELDKLRILAPFSGILESDTAELGTLLQPGALCATILQLDPMKLVGFANETDVDKIQVGAPAQGRFVNGKIVSGNVAFLSRSADDLTRTFRVEVLVANTDMHIRDGQTVEVIISAQSEKGHLLPASVLTLDDAGRLGVRVVDQNNIVRFQVVEMLRDTPEGVWLSGLPESVFVILVGQEYVTDGTPVRVSFEELNQ